MGKKYIKPSINVLEMTENEAILAASDGTTGTGAMMVQVQKETAWTRTKLSLTLIGTQNCRKHI